jgi:ketosteroid isomerase-like protein
MASVLEEKDRIRELLASYCFHYDEAQFDRWLALWTEDGVLDIDGRLMSGREGLEGFTKAAVLVDGRPPMKHIVMNEVISVEGDAATSRCYLLVVRKAPDGALAASTAGTYEDRLVKRNGRWYFARRKLRRDLRDEFHQRPSA